MAILAQRPFNAVRTMKRRLVAVTIPVIHICSAIPLPCQLNRQGMGGFWRILKRIFMIPVDAEGERFRYHPLFWEFPCPAAE